MDSKSDVSLPLLRKIAKIFQRDSTMKISHHSLILEVLNSCNEGSINIVSELAQGSKLAPKKEPHLSKKAREDFSSLTDYQIYTQNLTFKIKDHFSEVVNKIAGYLKQRDDESHPHIWASYEVLFFTPTIIPDIEKFYVLAYEGDAKLLQMLLPTADPRNMKLRGEWVIDILDPVKTTRQGTTEKALDSVSHVPLAFNLFEEIENLCPFLRETTLESTNLSNLHAITKASDEEDSGTPRSGATSTVRQAKALEDIDTHRSNPDRGQNSNQTLRGATSGDGAEKHKLYFVDSIPYVSLASNLVEEMDNLYTFLRNVTLGSMDLSNLPAITPEPQIVQKSKVQSGEQCLPPDYKSQNNGKDIIPEGPVSFKDMFSRAYKCLRMVIKESLPLVKLRWLVMCLQAVCDSLKEQVSCKLGGKGRSIGTDDLLPSLILFLIKGNPGEVTALYPQLKFLEDYLPDIVAAGIIGFSVTQFSVAFAVIIETDDVDS